MKIRNDDNIQFVDIKIFLFYYKKKKISGYFCMPFIFCWHYNLIDINIYDNIRYTVRAIPSYVRLWAKFIDECSFNFGMLSFFKTLHHHHHHVSVHLQFSSLFICAHGRSFFKYLHMIFTSNFLINDLSNLASLLLNFLQLCIFKMLFKVKGSFTYYVTF